MSRFSFTYLAYINSSAWRARRLRALDRADRRCQVCGERKWLQVHHVSYERLGHEADADLTVLCWWCHQWATWRMRFLRLVLKWRTR